MVDVRSYQVLEALAALRDSKDDVYKGYFWPITVAHQLGVSVDIVRDEYDVLAHAGFVELKPQPGGERIATLAIITARGDAELAARRKLKAAKASADAPPPSDHFDIFLSHASDDNAYAEPLYEALSTQFRVFFDKVGLRAGADFPFDLAKVIAGSDFGVFLITPAFMQKGYTREELGAFLHRVIEQKRPNGVIPVTYNTTFADVAAYNELLARRLQLDANTLPLTEIVREIALVVHPPAVSVASPASPRTKLYPDGPEDALPDQPHLLTILPRIDFTNEGVRRDGDQFALTFALHSVGPGDCYNVAYFLPGLDRGRVPQMVSRSRAFHCTVRLDQTSAFRDYVKAYYKAVFEFEDVAGNLYRQYGDVHQSGESAFTNYWVDNLTRPYLVAQRIIRIES